MANVKDKIRKLLSLAESPNENEAKLALLKARALMAEHKLTETDLRGLTEQKVVYSELGVTCTAMTDVWAAALGVVIAEHYCCKCVRRRKPGGKVNRIAFIGLEEDFDIAKKIYLYAHDCIKAYGKCIQKEKKSVWSASDIRKACNAYGNGFVAGLNQLYQEQEKDHSEWGLVMVTPKPVSEYMASLKTKNKPFGGGDERWTQQYREQGVAAGKQFAPSKRLN